MSSPMFNRWNRYNSNSSNEPANTGNTYRTYEAPIKNVNGIVKRSKTKRIRPNIRFRGKNLIEDSLFTRGELVDLINKSIYFLYRIKQKSFNQHINNRTGKKTNIFDVSPLYEKLIARLPIISNARQHNRIVPVIKLQYDNVYECDSRGSCINDDAIDLMEIKCSIVNGIDVAYIMYDGHRMSAIAKEPTFMNGLNEKEVAFMKMIFDNSRVLTDEGFRLNGFEAENIGKQLNAIVNKNRSARLRFSNTVHIKEIPNRKTMKNMMRHRK
jgi:hypothetical protein